MIKSVKDNIIRLFDARDDDLPETPLSAPRLTQEALPAPSLASAVDLSGKPRVVMTFGAGRSGKSTFLRWTVERAIDRDGETGAVLATVDALRPTLQRFFPSAIVPKQPDGLERLISRLIELKRTAAIDFGADASLVPLLTQVPNMHQMMLDHGVEPVVLYLLSPRSADLTVLMAMEAARFQPTATALILNMGTMVGQDPEGEFGQLRRHSVYKAAVERGAVEIWMPRLFAAKAVEDRGIAFRKAVGADGGLGLFDRSRVANWLTAMDLACAPIASWLL
jgi:hypothetical protein